MTPDQIAAMQADMQDGTPGDWDAAIESGCHGVIAQVLPSGANMVALVGNSPDTPEREPMRFANASRIARVPLMERTIIEQAAEIARLRAALGNAQYGLSWAVRYFKDQDVTKDDPCPPCTRGLSATRAALEQKP